MPVGLAASAILGMINVTARWFDPDRGNAGQLADVVAEIVVDGISAKGDGEIECLTTLSSEV